MQHLQQQRGGEELIYLQIFNYFDRHYRYQRAKQSTNRTWENIEKGADTLENARLDLFFLVSIQ